MRIACVNAPWYLLDTDGLSKHGVRAGCRWPSLGLGGGERLAEMRGNIYMPFVFHMAYAAALCQQYGHDVLCYDAIADCDRLTVFYHRIEEFDPEVIVFETASASWPHDLPIIQYLAAQGYKLCLVGPHASTYADVLIQEPFVTYIAQGEYDFASLAIANGGPPGVYPMNLPTDLDALPFPVLELPTCYHYNDYYGFPEFFEKPSFQCWTTRGCVYSCSYCLWTHTLYRVNGHPSYRQRSAENVLAEVDDRVQRLGFKHVLFDDDTFNIAGREEPGSQGYDRIVGICDGMAKRGMQWSWMGRMDTCSLDLMKQMYDSGAMACKLGAESFSDRTLKAVTKHLSASIMVDRIRALVDYGYRVYLAVTTMIPGETEEDRKQTDQILEELVEIGVKYQKPYMTPIPGTVLFQQFKDAGYDMESDFSLYDGGAGKLNRLIEDFNIKHGVKGFETGRHTYDLPVSHSGLPVPESS